MFTCYLFMICAFLSIMACISILSWNPLKARDLTRKILRAWYLFNNLFTATCLLRHLINFSCMLAYLLMMKYYSFLVSNLLNNATLRHLSITCLLLLLLTPCTFIKSIFFWLYTTALNLSKSTRSLCSLLTLLTLCLTFCTCCLSLKVHANSWLRSWRYLCRV